MQHAVAFDATGAGKQRVADMVVQFVKVVTSSTFHMKAVLRNFGGGGNATFTDSDFPERIICQCA